MFDAAGVCRLAYRNCLTFCPILSGKLPHGFSIREVTKHSVVAFKNFSHSAFCWGKIDHHVATVRDADFILSQAIGNH